MAAVWWPQYKPPAAMPPAPLPEFAEEYKRTKALENSLAAKVANKVITVPGFVEGHAYIREGYPKTWLGGVADPASSTHPASWDALFAETQTQAAAPSSSSSSGNAVANAAKGGRTRLPRKRSPTDAKDIDDDDDDDGGADADLDSVPSVWFEVSSQNDDVDDDGVNDDDVDIMDDDLSSEPDSITRELRQLQLPRDLMTSPSDTGGGGKSKAVIVGDDVDFIPFWQLR